MAAVALVPLWGCLHKGHPTDQTAKQGTLASTRSSSTTTTTRPATTRTSGSIVAFSKLNITFSYPAAWTSHESKDYELLLTAGKTTPASESIPVMTLDIPDLPPHFPGMIPIGLVKNGYIDDLKKEVGRSGLDTKEEPSKVAGAQGRMLRSTWMGKDQKATVELAFVLIHADRVYILRARFYAGDRRTPEVFDEIIGSIRWGK